MKIKGIKKAVGEYKSTDTNREKAYIFIDKEDGRVFCIRVQKESIIYFDNPNIVSITALIYQDYRFEDCKVNMENVKTISELIMKGDI